MSNDYEMKSKIFSYLTSNAELLKFQVYDTDKN